MNIDEYQSRFPNEYVWTVTAGTPGVIEEGMLAFDESAAHFAGPFEGGFCYYRLADMRDMPGWGPLSTVAELQQRQRFSHQNLPRRIRSQFGQPAQSEEHLQKRLALLTPKELKVWQEGKDKWRIDRPTLEFPIALKLAGNDDSTYTKFYPTLEAARAELDLFLADQPLNFDLHVSENGFVFTN
jgi:hypothetical protein